MSTILLKNRLKIVILKDSARIWSQSEDETFKNLFYKVIQLKMKGYEAEYPNGVLPIDTTDFFADHILICEEIEGSFIPLSGIKSTTLKDSEFHKTSFPGLSLVHAAETKPHIESMKELIQKCLNEKKNLAYTGSWTTLPEVRKNKALNNEVIRYFHAAYVLHHLENKIDEIITGGTIRFKADKFFGEMGHDLFCLKGQPLEPINVKHLFGERVQVLHLKRFTDEAIKKASLLQQSWNDRIEITPESVTKKTAFRRTG